MTYAQILRHTTVSAWSTLQILDRQARRDAGKIVRVSYRAYLWLSSPEMMHRYRRFMEMSRRIAEILWLVALAIGTDLQRLIEADIEACQKQPIAEVAGIEAAEPVQNTEPTPPVVTDAIVPFVRPAQPDSEVTPETGTTVTVDWSLLSPYDLRKECQARGIKWRSAHGKNKHLTKAEMIAALTASTDFSVPAGAIQVA